MCSFEELPFRCRSLDFVSVPRAAVIPAVGMRSGRCEVASLTIQYHLHTRS